MVGSDVVVVPVVVGVVAVVVVVPAVFFTALPFAATAHQRPPNAVCPCPSVLPACLSSAKP